MDLDEESALKFINELLEKETQRVLNNLETVIFKGCWSKKTLEDIAKAEGYAPQSIRDAATKLYEKLTQILKIKINKKNFISSIEHKYKNNNFSVKETQEPSTNNSVTPRVQNKINNNPFVPLSGKVDDEKLFFPRPRELNNIFEYLNNGSNVALIGEEGVGKSSFLWAIGHQSAHQLHQPRQLGFLDLNEISDNEDEFYEALCHKIGIPDSRRNHLNRNLKDKRILLTIDNVGKLAWQGFTRQVRDWLRSQADGMNAPLRLVLAASSRLEDLFQDSQDTSPLAGICQTENVVLWSEETIKSFINSRLQSTNVKFDELDIRKLIESSHGHPKTLMKLCNETYKEYSQRLK
ncbi:ATP-binding protein [Aetokthonos hydrillicola Thurmond2011]|jgi:GTPase SAR1 family protein|uniref:ATP-binding protein n=1 Tax=Aetokthonos hydrillicola Thurmond2011 TaxID=2712845 RepID=A0AAP5IGR6_9CYAN|nr:ATP-binding protein [Aetokthonos hydrillicola]MBO3459652.1 ATP-binding protein [Aetokthonos hydrillicola CCALA 1050]MBW4589014.1 ATP-binding protein [Aetokthonos hydrillicola CCALA 1050]MDR9900087.1 ATP-binding protein [Aetokthonos hydrillicola Thurmond2011]